MAGMGPAPKPEAQQRRKGRGLGAGATMRLPSSGRPGDPPAWPLPRQTKREKILWPAEWARPQAVAWERLGVVDVVARWVRLRAQSERPKAASWIFQELHQLEDRLGMSPMAMLRLRWEITDVGDDAGPNVVDIATRMDQVAD